MICSDVTSRITSLIWEVPRQESEFRAGSISVNIEAALQWLSQRKITISGLYSTCGPRDCQEAYQSLLTAQQKHLAIVFD